MKSSEFLNKNNPVTREEMQHYLEGNLSANDKIKVEEKMLDDEFSSEASEGFMENNVSFAEVGSLTAVWEAKTKTAEIKTTNYKNWFIGSAIIGTIALITSIYLISQPEKVETKYVVYQVSKTPLDENDPENYPQLQSYLNRDQYGDQPMIQGNYWNSENPPILNSREKSLSDSQLKSEIKNISESNPIEKSKQITYEKTIASQPTTVETKIPEEIAIVVDPNNVDGKKVEEIEVTDDKKIVESNVKMLYIKNLKAVDYSILYTNHIAKKEWILTGTTADKETATSEGVIAEHVIKYIPYKDFLIEGLTKFSKNDYKGALGHLLTILQQYPDDINASFYSGLCYFNLGKTRQAITMFDKTIGNSITTFKEESEWYKSLSLLEDGKKLDAKELMKKIESEGGFYAKAAREKLKSMK